MEKIIAVVIMVVIVIALIAGVVIPMQKSSTEQGNKANNQLNTIGNSMDGTLGSEVKTELGRSAADTKYQVYVDNDLDTTVAQLVSVAGFTKPSIAIDTTSILSSAAYPAATSVVGLTTANMTNGTVTTVATMPANTVTPNGTTDIMDDYVYSKSTMKDSATNTTYTLFVRAK